MHDPVLSTQLINYIYDYLNPNTITVLNHCKKI